jgi:hypothetical protein
MHSFVYRIRNHSCTEYANREFGKFFGVELLHSAGLFDYLEVTSFGQTLEGEILTGLW